MRASRSAIVVDTVPGTTVKGHVDSIAPASGQEFALLPPDNATGNFTKIVQRIPVKIVLDPGDPLAGELRPGHVGRPDDRYQGGRAERDRPSTIHWQADAEGAPAMATVGCNRAPRSARTDRASLTTWIAVLARMLGAFMAVLNIQITNASLLDIEGGIGTGVDNGAWISTAYLIGEIIVIPLTDYLSKVFSFRRYMIVNTILFWRSSVACAFAHDLRSMIAMRGLQGFTGGVLIPMAFTMVLTKLPKPQQPIGLAMFALSATFAPAIGPTIGGYLTENYGWQRSSSSTLVARPRHGHRTCLHAGARADETSLLKEGDWAGIVTMAIGLVGAADRA